MSAWCHCTGLVPRSVCPWVAWICNKIIQPQSSHLHGMMEGGNICNYCINCCDTYASPRPAWNGMWRCSVSLSQQCHLGRCRWCHLTVGGTVQQGEQVLVEKYSCVCCLWVSLRESDTIFSLPFWTWTTTSSALPVGRVRSSLGFKEGHSAPGLMLNYYPRPTWPYMASV